MLLTDSVIHEIDAARWLLSDELVAARVLVTRNSPLAPEGLRDPQLVILEAASGALVEVEVFVNCQYGYDVRCEIVGSAGTVSLGSPSSVTLTTAGMQGHPVAADWKVRFGQAYRDELQQWVKGARDGVVSARVLTMVMRPRLLRKPVPAHSKPVRKSSLPLPAFATIPEGSSAELQVRATHAGPKRRDRRRGAPLARAWRPRERLPRLRDVPGLVSRVLCDGAGWRPTASSGRRRWLRTGEPSLKRSFRL